MKDIPGSNAVSEALREQVLEVIATCAAPTIRVDLLKLLSRPGYALNPEGSCRAGMLSLEVHQAVVREPPGRTALLAAAAVELHMEAAYIFDEVADKHPYVKRSEDLALAIALLTTGAWAAVEAASGYPDSSSTLHHFCSSYTEACAGQFQDAVLQGRGEATLEESLQMTCLKSGGLGRFVAGFASRIAGADRNGIALFERLGSHTFTLGQLVDDLRDACGHGQTSDLAQLKATLPVVFFRQGLDSKVPHDGILSASIRRTYESSGAPLCVAILAHAYMSRAEEDLSLLARHGYAVAELGRFLERVESGARETLNAAGRGLVA